MANRESVIQGQANTQLSEYGKKQAILVGKRLQYEKFTLAFSSDLSRAADTAQAILEANQVSTCELMKDKRLRERSFGVMEGNKFIELQEMLKERKLSYKSFTPEGGESVEQVTKRASSFFKEICNIIASPNDEQLTTTSNQNSQCTCRFGANEDQETNSSKELGMISSCCVHVSDNSSSTVPELATDCLSIDTDLGASSSSASMDPHSTAQLKNGGQSDVNILIVSHGLWLKEFKKIVLNRYKGTLPDDITFLMNRVSPNTGVSKFAMTVSEDFCGRKKSVQCIECCFLDCKSHLRSLESGELAESKY